MSELPLTASERRQAAFAGSLGVAFAVAAHHVAREREATAQAIAAVAGLRTALEPSDRWLLAAFNRDVSAVERDRRQVLLELVQTVLHGGDHIGTARLAGDVRNPPLDAWRYETNSKHVDAGQYDLRNLRTKRTRAEFGRDAAETLRRGVVLDYEAWMPGDGRGMPGVVRVALGFGNISLRPERTDWAGPRDLPSRELARFGTLDEFLIDPTQLAGYFRERAAYLDEVRQLMATKDGVKRYTDRAKRLMQAGRRDYIQLMGDAGAGEEMAREAVEALPDEKRRSFGREFIQLQVEAGAGEEMAREAVEALPDEKRRSFGREFIQLQVEAGAGEEMAREAVEALPDEKRRSFGREFIQLQVEAGAGEEMADEAFAALPPEQQSAFIRRQAMTGAGEEIAREAFQTLPEDAQRALLQELMAKFGAPPSR